jgi:3-hydroxybutyryl-CoA dehydrogenase
MKTATEVKKVTVMGAGTMGPGIAQIFAMAGCGVFLYDIAPEALEKAKTVLRASLETFAEEGLIGKEMIEPLAARVSFSASLEKSVQDADLVVEAIVENRDVKAAVYRQLDALLPAETIIASNTSFLNIFEIMPAARLPYTSSPTGTRLPS